jgi:pyruvate dehydrogenase E2 component (dihydrolipoamide acetyltransferase)
MPVEITMPQMSDTMTEGTVVKWHKKEGDKVNSGEELADIETDKATMPMEAFESGTLAFIAAKEGDKVNVGDLIAVIAKSSEKADDVKKQFAAGASAHKSAGSNGPAIANKPTSAAAEGVAPPAPHGGSVATLEGASRGEVHEPDHVGHGATRQPPRAVPSVPGHDNGDGRIKASPLARRIATDKGVDLASLQGSGPGGRIVQKDVEAAAAGGPNRPQTAAPTPSTAANQQIPPAISIAPIVGRGEKKTVTMTKMRTAIAAALQRSKQIVPHFYETLDIDMEELSKLRERINARLEKEKIRLSIMDFVYKAVAAALLRHPNLNARFNPEKGEITQYGDVNLGIAVSIPDGLIVPVLRTVNAMTLRDIRVRSSDLIDRARAQRLKREEQTEATFTISSLGTFGIREFSAIINPPEVGILAVGAAEKRPVVRDGQITPRTIMTVTLSCDHRVVDGATAAEFLRTLKEILEEPGMMLV